jgi:hypothetical protein
MRQPWSTTRNKRELRRIYIEVIPTIRKVARRAGYAIGVHGSLTRDLDLIAAPWRADCVEAGELARLIESAVAQYKHDRAHFESVRKNFTEKPHGRRSFSIHLGIYAYIDLSVMPRRSP